MDTPLNLTSQILSSTRASHQAAQALGALLSQAPAYREFLQMLKVVNDDQAVQKLGTEMRKHRSAMQWGTDSGMQHAAELARLEEQMENLPSVKEYRRTEHAVEQLFLAVDRIITEQAGVAFAANAKRGGCCG